MPHSQDCPNPTQAAKSLADCHQPMLSRQWCFEVQHRHGVALWSLYRAAITCSDRSESDCILVIHTLLSALASVV